MKAVILAGGFGSRLSEETQVKPKPMVEIGGKPILWHIMNIYAAHGITEFVIALGYRGDTIKSYFLNFCTANSDLTVDLATGRAVIHDNGHPSWTVHLVDTGLHTQTGGRLGRLDTRARCREERQDAEDKSEGAPGLGEGGHGVNGWGNGSTDMNSHRPIGEWAWVIKELHCGSAGREPRIRRAVSQAGGGAARGPAARLPRAGPGAGRGRGRQSGPRRRGRRPGSRGPARRRRG